MSKSLTLSALSIAIPWTYDKDSYPANVKDDNNMSYNSTQLTSGTGAGKANIKYSAQLSISASSSTTLDLSSLVDSFGDTISFARIKEFYIENSNATAASSIKVGGAGANAFNAIWSAPGTANNDTYLTINNGVAFNIGVDQSSTSYAVGSNNQLLITNNDNTHSATVNILIVGCDA